MNGLRREGTEYSYPLEFEGKQQYFRRINSGNSASNYFQQLIDGVLMVHSF